ncbi:hypothetical protein [Prevotella nigrescens]
MNTIIMNQDVLKNAISRRDNRSELPLSSRLNEIVHTPAFIKADASNKTDNIKQQSTSPKQVRRFFWTRFIELAILLSIVIGVIWLISKIVTPQVVTTVSVILGFLILRFIVRMILQVTFTILRYLLWTAILIIILLYLL